MQAGKLTAWLLTLAMVLTLAPPLGGTAKALGTSWSGTVTADATETVSGVVLSGDATLKINEGVTLTVNGGIGAGGHTLTVEGPGKLVVTGLQTDYGGAGVSGKLTVTGGTVEVAGGDGTDGAGGHGVSGTLTVSGGTVTVTGGVSYTLCAAGHGVVGDVAVSGGKLTVTGGNGSSYQAGHGVNGNVALSGGDITVRGGSATPSMYNGVSVTGSVTVTGAFTDNAANYDNLTSDQAKEILNSGKSLRQVVVVGTWSDLETALAAGGGVVLAADVTPDNALWADALAVPSGKTATLDLNGHIVDRGLKDESSGISGGYVLKVDGGLTLVDSSPAAAHGAPYGGLPAGGVLTGGYADQYGGGVYMSGGAFTMNGGSIVGNCVGQSGFTGTEGLGGGVYVQSGTFAMSGGAITGNSALGSKFGSKLGRGGGVYVNNGAFLLSGGSVTGNEAGEYGGGVYVASTYSSHSGTLTVSGGATVTDNTAGGSANNVYLENGGVITVTGPLTDAASVGATMQTPGAFTSGLSGKGAASNFTSDDAAYYVALGGGEAVLTAKTEQEPTPDATFTATGADSGELSGLVANAKYSLSGAGLTAAEITAGADGKHAIASGMTAGTLSIVKKYGATTLDSNAQTIAVTKADTPSLTVTQPAAIGGTGSVATTAAHEWSVNGTSWNACSGALAGLVQGSTVYVRVKASGTVLASANQTVTINTFGGTPEDTPNAIFTATGADCGELSGLAAGAKYSVSGAGLAAAEITAGADGKYVIASSLAAGTLSVVKAGNGSTTLDSAAQAIAVTKADKPAGLGKTDCASIANNDGTLTGLDSAKKYEYKTTGGYTAVADGAETITNLTPGDYRVRVAATGAVLASADSDALTVNAYTPSDQVAAPAFSPAAGAVDIGTEVTISCATQGATIHFTTDGSAPTEASPVYDHAYMIGEDTTLIAFAVKAGMTDSETATAAYTITAAPPTCAVTYKVVNGTWSDGSAADKTETVTSGATPASVPTGMIAGSGFTGGAWDADPAAAIITGATTFTYTFTAAPTYTVTVVNGTGGGSFAPGASVAITADAPAGGTVFDRWTSGDGVSFADALSASTTFPMPAQNVTVTATYRSTGGSGGGGGGSGGGSAGYAPSVSAPEHGTVAISPQNPKAGDTVTVTATPEAGYQLARVDVTDANGKKLAVRYESGKPAFTQPAGKVEIQAVFAPVPQPAGATPAAVASPQSLTVNGTAQSVEAYNVGGTNFFKLRDLAALLRGAPAQFGVDFDAARNVVVITTGKAYEGAAGTAFADNAESAVVSPQTVEIDGREVSLTAYNIGGSNFFGLRELALFLGYDVDFDAQSNTAQIASR